jgi:glutathione S-transferase
MSANPELVLHHYPASPYAEKIRAILGFKQLKWKSVTIPAVMPKPDVVALTGGYRRTPVLQIGADVYCDSGLIARAIDDYAPSPTLFPYGDTLAMEAITYFAEAVLFNTGVPLAFTPATVNVFFPDATPEFLATFRADRTAMRKGGTARRGPINECRAIVLHFLPKIDAQFRDGRPFVMGATPCLADFGLYHTLWPIWRAPGVRAILNPFPKTYQFVERIAKLGHGSPTEISSGKALEIANASKPLKIGYGLATELEDVKLGDTVEVLPVDYAFDPVAGELITASADEIVVRRSDPRAGVLQVHFPRFGYEIRKAA